MHVTYHYILRLIFVTVHSILVAANFLSFDNFTHLLIFIDLTLYSYIVLRVFNPVYKLLQGCTYGYDCRYYKMRISLLDICIRICIMFLLTTFTLLLRLLNAVIIRYLHIKYWAF
jgi:hypothetical protein